MGKSAIIASKTLELRQILKAISFKSDSFIYNVAFLGIFESFLLFIILKNELPPASG